MEGKKNYGRFEMNLLELICDRIIQIYSQYWFQFRFCLLKFFVFGLYKTIEIFFLNQTNTKPKPTKSKFVYCVSQTENSEWIYGSKKSYY